jgi:hypothetical protein
MMVKKNGVQYFTPGYDIEQFTDGDRTHTYGMYTDLDYDTIDAITVETAVFNKMLPVTDSKTFNAEKQLNYAELKDYLSNYYDITDQFDGLDINAVPTEVEFAELLEKVM